MSLHHSGGALLAALMLSACAGGVIPPSAGGPAPSRPSNGGEGTTRPVPATPRPTLPPKLPTVSPDDLSTDQANAAGLGVTPGPDIASLIPSGERARAALQAFLISCPTLMKRTDQSGLTRGSDWNSACSAASSWPEATAAEFFSRYFEAVQVGEGKAFVTGYYEPEIAGSRTRQPGYQVPIYRRPAELIDVNLGLFSDSLKGRTIRGKVQGSNFVPFDERSQIVDGSLAGRGLELAWAADPVEFFFLQVQGSGRLTLPDGGVMRIGYDGQNGRDYTGIGKLMKDRGLLGPGQTSMQGIVAWLHAHPAEGRAIMEENKSFVFFRELDTPPVGAMGYVVSGGISAAVDTRFVPLGAPVFLSMDRQDASGLWVAQDTGGAIKGSNRFDTYWGAGPAAEATAGGMAARGTAFLLLPKGTLARIGTQAAAGAPAQF